MGSRPHVRWRILLLCLCCGAASFRKTTLRAVFRSEQCLEKTRDATGLIEIDLDG